MGEGVTAMWRLLIGSPSSPLDPLPADTAWKEGGSSESSSLRFEQRYLQPPNPAVLSANSEALSFSGKVPSWLVERAGGKAGLGEFKGRLRAALKDLAARGQVNYSQMGAIEGAMMRRLSLWQGPPGTGKTRTLLHFISLVIRLLKDTEGGRSEGEKKGKKGGRGEKSKQGEKREERRGASDGSGRVCRGRVLAVADRYRGTVLASSACCSVQGM